MKTIETRRFGPITIDPSKCFTFPDGVLGFSNLRDFALIDHKQDETFLYLQSLEEPWITFPVIDYSATKGQLSIVTISDNPVHMTTNKKAPIFLDYQTMTGAQVIQKDPDLKIREPIFDHLAAIAQKGIKPKSTSVNLDLCCEVNHA